MATLDTAVNHLDDLDTLVPDLKKLGAFHGMLGVQKDNCKASSQIQEISSFICEKKFFKEVVLLIIFLIDLVTVSDAILECR